MLILRLYNGGDIAGWVTEMKLPIATTGVLEQLLKGIRAELVRFAEHVVGNPEKVSEWAMIKARDKLAKTVRETDTTKIERAKGRAEMMKKCSCVLITTSGESDHRSGGERSRRKW